MKRNPYSMWLQFSKFPLGRRIFSCALGWMIPYTGTIRARLLEWSPGHALVQVGDRRRIRNHLRCVHAVALANLGELSSGLSLHSLLPQGSRAILLGLHTEYLKKARGTLTAEATCPRLSGSPEQDLSIESVIKNRLGEIVCKVRADWRMGPERS